MLVETLLIGAASAAIWKTGPPTRPRAAEQRRRQVMRPRRAVPTRPPQPPQITQVNREIALMGVSLGMILGGLAFYPPLFTAGVALNLIAAGPALVRDLYIAVVKERRIGMAVLEVSFATLLIATGQFVAVALCSLGFLIGRKLVLHTEAYARAELRDAFALQTATAWVKQDGQEIETPIDALHAGDVIVVGAGGVVPVDGTIAAGTALLDQRILTGESAPVERAEGDAVYAPTIVLTGRVEIRVDKAGAETTAAELQRLLLEAANAKQALHSRGEAIADASAPPTLAAGAAGLLLGMPSAQIAGLINANFGRNLTALGPIAMLRHMAHASRNGVLIKEGLALETLAKVDVILFDKTGTLTRDALGLNRIHCFKPWRAATLLRFAAAAQQTQAHPIAVSLKSAAADRELTLPQAETVAYHMGLGLGARIEGRDIALGGAKLMDTAEIAIDAPAREALKTAEAEGATVVWMAVDGRLAGAFDLRAALRPEAAEVTAALRKRGVKSIQIVSGDAPAPTRAIAETLEVDAWHAEIRPEQKAELVKNLQAKGRKVCFIGDGINDAIALQQADVSISLSAAASIASDTAKIVLLDDGLSNLPLTFDLAHSFARRLDAGVYASVAPGLIAMGAVLFFQFGVIGTILINQTGLVAGMTVTAGKPSTGPKTAKA